MLKLTKFLKDEKASMDMLGSIAIGLLGLVIIFWEQGNRTILTDQRQNARHHGGGNNNIQQHKKE